MSSLKILLINIINNFTGKSNSQIIKYGNGRTVILSSEDI